MDTPVIGLKDLLAQHEARIRNGMKAYTLLEELRAGSTDQAVRDEFNNVKKDLGYGLLLKRYTPNVSDATEAQIAMATKRLYSSRCAAVLRVPYHGGLRHPDARYHRGIVLDRYS
ncbi:Cytochrome d ubiquinol oxidase subunit 1 [Raoultella planticola]|uniref:Cytochrome d ubiquinol oxidase subunit 1 n=1 Tax=Raoultella planticola TaxID=575 RepID=A0A485AU82_RAOPL|nr:Cytochrome d ubiquinol oxidase subunit 1 [Raoultella planticola]